jgi:hypothetical protein
MLVVATTTMPAPVAAPVVAESEREIVICAGDCGGRCVACRHGHGAYLAKCDDCCGAWTFHRRDGACIRGLSGYHADKAA